MSSPETCPNLTDEKVGCVCPQSKLLRTEVDNLKVMPWFVYICGRCRWTSKLMRSGTNLTHDCVTDEAIRAEERAAFIKEHEALHAVGEFDYGTCCQLAAAIGKRT